MNGGVGQVLCRPCGNGLKRARLDARFLHAVDQVLPRRGETLPLRSVSPMKMKEAAN
jgi:hypothetical protein